MLEDVADMKTSSDVMEDKTTTTTGCLGTNRTNIRATETDVEAENIVVVVVNTARRLSLSGRSDAAIASASRWCRAVLPTGCQER